jgi:hypothetical protein
MQLNGSLNRLIVSQISHTWPNALIAISHKKQGFGEGENRPPDANCAKADK